MTEQLAKARAYEAAHMGEAEKRPLFHFTPPTGWMNDPNGFSLYGGKHHLFFQYNPYAAKWGPMHWGHCVTEDFIHWKTLPAALAPDSDADLQGCFSGGAVAAPNGRHALIYTGCRWKRKEGHDEDVRQRQCIAFGDGLDYEKPAVDGKGSNVVIDGGALPESFSREDFRDPKVWKDGDFYRMLVVNRAADGCGQMLKFHSEDLLNWRYDGVVAHNDGARHGIMWECAEMAKIDGRAVYFVSGQDMRAAGREFQSGNHAFYFFGDKNGNAPRPLEPRNLDYGFDYYATQTLKIADGRIIQIAWMQNWDTDFKPLDFKWNGQLTLPREMTIRNGALYQNPVRELMRYRQDLMRKKGLTVRGVWRDDLLSGRVMDLNIDIYGGQFREFAIHFAHDDNFDFAVVYDRAKQTLTVDRTLIGSVRDIPTVRSMPLHKTEAHKDASAPLKLRIILDKYSAEIFANDGAQTFTATFYTPLSADKIFFESDGEAVVDLDAYRILP